MERYATGYYPSNNAQDLKPVSYSSFTGDFQTMPYPSSGTTFVANGAGCRTAYWADHVSAWPAFVPVTAKVVDLFGEKASATYGDMTILEGLLQHKTDPYSALLTSSCTAILNAYTRGEYPIPHIKVIELFNAALVSKDAALKQATEFETENIASISAGTMCT
jgi:hypothetical protein